MIASRSSSAAGVLDQQPQQRERFRPQRHLGAVRAEQGAAGEVEGEAVEAPGPWRRVRRPLTGFPQLGGGDAREPPDLTRISPELSPGFQAAAGRSGLSCARRQGPSEITTFVEGFPMALIVGGPKSDKLFGNDPVENDIFGDALAMARDKGGNDTLIGGAIATNHLRGDALSMNRSVGGNDSLIGGAKDTCGLFSSVGATYRNTSSAVIRATYRTPRPT